MARALYIHWPFCLKKCPYCDFNSHVRDGVDIDRWQAALIADMRHEAALAGGEALAAPTAPNCGRPNWPVAKHWNRYSSAGAHRR